MNMMLIKIKKALLNYRLFTELLLKSITNTLFLITFDASQENYLYAISFLEKRKRQYC